MAKTDSTGYAYVLQLIIATYNNTLCIFYNHKSQPINPQLFKTIFLLIYLPEVVTSSCDLY